MVLKKFTIAGALLAALASSYSAQGQINVPSAEFDHRPLEKPTSSRPFASPGIFDYDAQVFAPFEFTNDEEKKPHQGFFASVDRTYTSVSRSGSDGSSNKAQSTGNHYLWGNRYEAGWINSSDNGWHVGFQESDGLYFTNGQDTTALSPTEVENRFATFELNRIFRQELSHGGYFEPYLGFQYLNFNDKTTDDSQIARFRQEVDNNAIGLHAGARFNKRAGRWRFTSDGAIAAAYNQQSYFATNVGVIESNHEDQSFVPVLDLQFEASYNISRDISFRSGVQALWVFDGIARANTLAADLNPNSSIGTDTTGAGIFDESYVAAGFIFGFEWRR